MLTVSSQTRVYVYREPCDMRRSFEGLACLVREYLREDPLSGHLFVFMSRCRSRMKVLYWDRTGFALWYKRLERGTFSVPKKMELTPAELQCVLEGLEIEGVRRKKRFSL